MLYILVSAGSYRSQICRLMYRLFILLVLIYLSRASFNEDLDEVPFFENSQLDRSSPLFITYTTGGNERVDLTTNLLNSLQLHSPQLYANHIVACLDVEACDWCKQRPFDPRACYCIADHVTGVKGKGPDADKYASALWSASVLKKVGVIRSFLKSNFKYAVFADQDVVVLSSLDEIFLNSSFQEPIITMCDFPKKFRPQYKMANTGFILIRNIPESNAIVDAWNNAIFQTKEPVTNDQPPFQEVVKQSKFLKSHRCADEDEGFASWFHKKKLSGSGLNKQYYFNNKRFIKVFHANDIESSSKKVDVLKRLKMWYVNNTVAQAPDLSRKHTNKFFIYDWPIAIVDLKDPNNLWKHDNYGAGPILDFSSGQFNTYMHSLFP